VRKKRGKKEKEREEKIRTETEKIMLIPYPIVHIQKRPSIHH
jgi:hypothetical protein